MPRSMFAVVSTVLSALLLAGCGGATSPEEEPDRYAQLVRVTAAEMRAEEDTTRLWLRNNDNPQVNDLMLGLGLDFVRYDAERGVVCAWSGGGMMPARGFVYRLPPDDRLQAASDTADTSATRSPVPADSLGDACYRSGRCTETPVTDDWVRFECP